MKAISLENEAGFKTFFTHVTTGILVAGKDGHIELINPCAEKLFGCTNAELTGHSLDKLEQGKIEAEISTFNLQEFLEDIIGEMEGMLKKKNQQINYIHNGHIEIMQDKKILRNVMLNLMSNAIKYSPEEKEIIISSHLN